MITRREALVAAAGATCSTAAKTGPEPLSNDPREALLAFLRAFENCDLPRMELAFAADATYFDRAPLFPGDPAQYRRGQGMPPGMRLLASTLPDKVTGPPYQRVKPENLACDRYGETALCTFELDSVDALGRRTILLRQQGDGWKIVHIHASNIYH